MKSDKQQIDTTHIEEQDDYTDEQWDTSIELGQQFVNDIILPHLDAFEEHCAEQCGEDWIEDTHTVSLFMALIGWMTERGWDVQSLHDMVDDCACAPGDASLH